MRVRGREPDRGRLARRFWSLALLGVLALAVLLFGRSTASAEASAGTFILNVPYLSQFDGSPYAGSNCGPTSLAMVLRAYGRSATIGGVRARVNRLQGTDAYDSGTSLETIAAIAREAGLTPVGLLNGNQHARWSRNGLLSQLRAGNPVIPEVRYRQLPGHSDAAYDGDHYVVLVGVDGNDVIYNDPAFHQDGGNARRTSFDRILSAMADSAFPYAAVAIAPGPSGAGLIRHPTETPVRPVAAPAVAKAPPMVEPPRSDYAWKVLKETGGGGNEPASSAITNGFSDQPSIRLVENKAGNIASLGDRGQLDSTSSVKPPGAMAPVSTPSRPRLADVPGRSNGRGNQPHAPTPWVERNVPRTVAGSVAGALFGLLAIGYIVARTRQSYGSLVFLSTTDRSVLGRVRLSRWPLPVRWDRQSCARFLPEVGLQLLVARAGPTIAGRATVRVTLVGPDGHVVIRIFHDLDSAFLSDSADREVIYQAAARSSLRLTLPASRLVRSADPG